MKLVIVSDFKKFSVLHLSPFQTLQGLNPIWIFKDVLQKKKRKAKKKHKVGPELLSLLPVATQEH